MSGLNPYMREEAAGILVARLPQAKQWEPLLVTTLRRYVRRGVSDRLLHRLAGGRGWFDLLNRTWDLDGRSLSIAVHVEPDHLGNMPIDLGVEERRVALYQVITEHLRVGRMMPTTLRLARYFNTTAATIDSDLDTLCDRGLIRVSRSNLHGDVSRQVRLLPRAIQ